MLINYVNFKTKQLAIFKQTLNEVFLLTLKTLEISCDLEVNLFLTSKHEIKKINKQTRNVNKVTDVLSFPNLNLQPKDSKNLTTLVTKENFKNDINPQTNNLFLGDIMLCYLVIKKQAKKFENTLMREMCYMTVHGLLHLLGFDHLNESDKKQMRLVEENVLQQLGLSR